MREANGVLHDSRLSAAAALETAAKNLRAGADTVSRAGHDAVDTVSRVGHDAADSVSRVGHDAADKVKSGAKVVRTYGARQLMTDFENIVKTHPGKSIAAAVVVGFLAARALRND
jgi:ElaB/YqjD/DUF883 family membrane-anchored ribosome-binding protein